RGREDRSGYRRGGDGALRERLGAEEAGALDLARAQGAEEHEALDARPLGGAEEARGGEAVQLLDPGAALVADRRGEVDHGVHPPQSLALDVEVAGAPEVPERDLHVHPVAPEPARVANQGPHLLATLK